uniref:Uncharacterized protein n=1 Tax=Romanomermis culicivorax TaxID=13658 RepID=A0A915LB33_ROMCU
MKLTVCTRSSSALTFLPPISNWGGDKDVTPELSTSSTVKPSALQGGEHCSTLSLVDSKMDDDGTGFLGRALLRRRKFSSSALSSSSSLLLSQMTFNSNSDVFLNRIIHVEKSENDNSYQKS